MPDHALEFVFDAASQEQIRGDWQALSELGIPSCGQHSGATNAPHLTLLSAGRLGEETEQAARQALAAVLPLRVDLDGLVVLGRRKLVVAHLLRPGRDLLAAVQTVAATCPQRRHPWWLPHISVSTRVPPDRIGEVVAAMTARRRDDAGVVLTGLRRWDPDAATVRTVIG